ncbi:MAG: hypothetical protein HY000_22190 [Planctomycetes bacterium]|nr:hypothetical protein [Planctomycetota bacterium]
MSAKKPVPLTIPELERRPVCSVCGKVSYSRGGIHPQCAEEQADAVRIGRLKEARKAENAAVKAATVKAKPEPLSRWHKLCPKCRKKLHVRKLSCDCGHRFSQTEEK